MTTYQAEPLTMDTHYFKMWIRIAAFVNMQVQTPHSACGWPSGFAKSSACSRVIRLSDIILKRRKTNEIKISVLCAWVFFFSLASMWLLLSYMNDDLFLCLREVKVTVCCKASIPKQNCKTCNYHFDFCWKMYIDMAFLFVYVFLARAHFLCYIFPNKYWKLVDILDMAQGSVKYKVGYELHCGEKELAFFCILVYVPFYVYILFFLKLLLNVIDFSFWIHLLRDLFSVGKKKKKMLFVLEMIVGLEMPGPITLVSVNPHPW